MKEKNRDREKDRNNKGNKSQKGNNVSQSIDTGTSMVNAIKNVILWLVS